MPIKNHHHYLAGPDDKNIISYELKHKNTCLKYLRKLDDQQKKMSLIKSFDLYFYDTYGPEGASVAILESLASGVPVLCKPLGGNSELVKNGVNGYYYSNFKEAKNIIMDLYNNRDKLEDLKRKTEEDFDKRLTIKYCVNQYNTLIEKFQKGVIL